MSNNLRHNKRWLISRLKTSGSERRYVFSQTYAEDRHKSKTQELDELPKFEGIGQSTKFYNGKINTSLLKRFLETKIGFDWNQVYEEIQQRIPTKLQEYHQVIFWYVADKIEIIDSKVFDLRDQKFINFETMFVVGMVHKDFIVSCLDNKLYRYKEFGEQLNAATKRNLF
jgi:hypothetical protein